MIEKFYLGTYTKRKSKGIYSIKLDEKKEKLYDLKLEYEVNNPTYICKFEDNIFSVSNEKNQGGISWFKDGKILAKNHHESSTPCYIDYSKKHKLIATANYHTANICLYEIKNKKIILKSKISNINNEKISHMHYSKFSDDIDCLFVCDLGKSKIITYKIEKGELTKVSEYKADEKSGARHIVFHPQKNICYLICELNSTIEILDFDKKNLTFKKINTVNLAEKNEKKWASAIKITKNGKFLYASNRGDDYIFTFEVDNEGNLKLIQKISSFGKVVRDFTLSKDEKYLIAGHQESDNLSLFKIDKGGKLLFLNNATFAPEVVNIINNI